MRERRDSLLKQTQKMCQIVLSHVLFMNKESPNVGHKTLRDRSGQAAVNHDDSSIEQTMLNEMNMDFRIQGLPHCVVKHAYSTCLRELIQHSRRGEHRIV